MHKVVTINLNGRAYQLDDDAYDKLGEYLDRASTALAGNPDRSEILLDLEQAIADKCVRYLAPPKTVVSAGEIITVLDEMGPVDAGADEPASAGPSPNNPSASVRRADQPRPRRLYRINEGAMLGGICTGLAAFTGLDVTVIRAVVFFNTALELALSHTGIFAIIYVVLMFVLPEAQTSEERAAASGMPFNAQALVDRVKQVHRKLDRDWRRDRADARREWRQKQRDWKRQWRANMMGHGAAPPYYADYGSRVFAGLTLPVLVFLSVGSFWVGVYLVLTLLRAGSVPNWEPFGVQLDIMDGMPLWVSALIVFAVFNAVVSPIHLARRALRDTLGDTGHSWFTAWDGLLGLGFGVLVLWLAYTNVPEVHELTNQFPLIWDNLRESFRQ